VSSGRPVTAVVLVSERRQDGEGKRADAAGGTGDQHVAAIRVQAVLLQGHHGEHGGEAGGPGRHRAAEAEPAGERYEPLAAHPSPLRIAAPVQLADPPPGEHDLVTGMVVRVGALQHHAGQVDPRDVRITAHQPAQAAQDHAVLVVEAGVTHVHGDVALRQVGVPQVADLAADATVLLVEHQSFELVASRWGPSTRITPRSWTPTTIDAVISGWLR